MSRNRLTTQDIAPLLQTLSNRQHSQKLYNSTLRLLDLSNNSITDDGFPQLIAVTLPYMKGLQNLYLLNNDITKRDSSVAILEAIKVNVWLSCFELKYSTDDYHEIQYYVALNKGGRQLLAIDTHVPLALWPRVLGRASSFSWSKESVASAVPCAVDFSHDILFHLLRGPALLHRNF